MTNMAVFEGKKSSNNIIINDTMGDDEVVASDVPRGTCYSSHYRVSFSTVGRKEKGSIERKIKYWICLILSLISFSLFW